MTGAAGHFPAAHRLTEQLGLIASVWGTLKGQQLHGHHLADFAVEIHQLSELAEHDFPRIQDPVATLRRLVDALVADPIPLNLAQIEHITQLIDEIQARSETAFEDYAQGINIDATRLYVLGECKNALALLAAELNERGLHCGFFKNTEALGASLQETLPAGILVDESLCDEAVNLAELVNAARADYQQALPMMVIGGADNLQRRLRALRNGATNLFPAPINPSEVSDRIWHALTPEDMTQLRVLFIEDDDYQAEIGAEALRAAGIHADPLSEPMYTLDVIASMHPDLLVIDLNMPEIDGMELTRIIRSMDDYAALPIVFLSAEDDIRRQMAALRSGGDDFLTKPLNHAQLINVVRNRLQRTAKIREHALRVRHQTQPTQSMTLAEFEEQASDFFKGLPSQRQNAGIALLGFDQTQALLQALGGQGLERLRKQLSDRIAGLLEPTDQLIKLPNYQVGLLLNRDNFSELEDIPNALHRITTALETREQLSDPATLGIGICLLNAKDKHDISSLVTRTSSALARAYKEGPAQTALFTIDYRDQATGNSLQRLLDEALRSDSFVVQYQPLLSLDNDGGENYEVQLRLESPIGTLLDQEHWRDVMPSGDTLVEIDRWLLKRAIALLNERAASHPNTHIFVRQSKAALLNTAYLDWIKAQMAEAQPHTGTLVIDFRLPDVTQDLKGAHQRIHALQTLGIQVTLSRFIDKPAAFKVVSYLGPDYVRVSPGLLKAQHAGINKVVTQVKQAGTKVIVAGIDDGEHLNRHWSVGADYLQGDFIQRPLDTIDFDFSQVVM